MNTKAFLRDWQPGDIVTADDMQALADTVAMLESAGPTGGAAPGGSCRRVTDGPQGWPWQVVALHGEDKYELRVVPGKVLAGIRTTGYGEGLGEEEVAYTYLELPATEGADVVQDYDATKDVATVYLELTGRVARRYLTWGDMLAAGLMDDPYGMMTDAEKAQKTGHEVVSLEDATLRVTCAPADTALRIWPLAVVTKAHAQPVTQLQWGDLSALECRGIARTDGKPVWPSDRTQAAAWGTTAHADGMDAVAPVEFSTAAESIEGTLRACMDEDGALEFYLGEYTEPGEIDDPPTDDPPWEEEDEEDDEDDTPPGPFYPPGDDDDGGGGGGGITRVRYGYVAGEGFLSCDLVRAGDGKLYWQLVLDPDYLSRICANLPCPATVTVQGDGTQAAGSINIEMGLGEVSISATGMMLRGTAAFVFAGHDHDDARTKRVTRKVTYKGSPVWSQPRTWYLTPNKVHQAGRYVILDKAANGYSPGGFVEARQWYRFRVNKATFTRAARNEFKKALGTIKVQNSKVATSSDSSVVGTLTGTATAPVFDFRLQDA